MKAFAEEFREGSSLEKGFKGKKFRPGKYEGELRKAFLAGPNGINTRFGNATGGKQPLSGERTWRRNEPGPAQAVLRKEHGGLDWMGKCFKIIFRKSSELCRGWPVGKRRWFEAGAKVETQIWFGWKGEKVRLVRKRELWEDNTGSVQRDQRRDLVRTKIKRLHDRIGRVLPCSSSLLEYSLAYNIRSPAFPPCFALPFSPFITRLREYRDLPVAKVWVLPQIRIPMKTWPKGLKRNCGAY